MPAADRMEHYLFQHQILKQVSNKAAMVRHFLSDAQLAEQSLRLAAMIRQF